MNKWNYKSEAKNMPIFYKWISDPIRKQRIETNMSWAFTKAKKYLMLHFSFFISIILLNSLIPVLIKISNCEMPFSLVITMISFLAVILTALKEGLKTRELWLNYRFSLEFAKTECMKCYNKVEKYNKPTQEENERILCDTLESFIGNIVFEEWKKTFEVNMNAKLKEQ